MQICLASTSKYRQELLTRLGLKFEAKKPVFDEDQEKHNLLDQTPEKIAQFLAHGKAASLHTENQLTIGSDQLVSFQNQILGKTPTKELAFEQLQSLQGKKHELITAVCVLVKNLKIEFTDKTILKMRPLTKKEIESYIEFDSPFDCAGTYKIEKRGISLFDEIETKDFTAIQGLPLIALTKVLRSQGFAI